MVKFVELDENVKLQQQMEEDIRPVILINTFHIKPGDEDELKKAWASDAAFFKQQPGYISTQLHKGIGKSCTFVNYAVWESTRHYKDAFNKYHTQEVQSTIKYPESAVGSPHLFKKVAITNICVE